MSGAFVEIFNSLESLVFIYFAHLNCIFWNLFFTLSKIALQIHVRKTIFRLNYVIFHLIYINRNYLDLDSFKSRLKSMFMRTNKYAFFFRQKILEILWRNLFVNYA